MDDDELQPAVRAAYTIDQPARRGGRQGLSLRRIVDAAVEIADGAGLAAVSMARVASRLGYTTMSLYRHVGSKDELLSHMQDAALPAPPAGLAELDWRDGLRRWTEAQLAGAIARPWSLDLPITGPPLMPTALAWTEQAMAIVAELPLYGTEKLALLNLLTGHARNEASVALTVRRANEARGIAEQEEAPLYAHALGLVAEGRFPLLHELATTGELFSAPAGEDPEAHYARFPIDRILDGVAALVARRRRGESEPGTGGQDLL